MVAAGWEQREIQGLHKKHGRVHKSCVGLGVSARVQVEKGLHEEA